MPELPRPTSCFLKHREILVRLFSPQSISVILPVFSFGQTQVHMFK